MNTKSLPKKVQLALTLTKSEVPNLAVRTDVRAGYSQVVPLSPRPGYQQVVPL